MTAPAPDESAPAETSLDALASDLPANAIDIILGDAVTVAGCRYTVGTAMLNGPPWPPTYIAFVQRTAVGYLCPNHKVYQLFFDPSYNRPVADIARGASGELAVAATNKITPSGSSPSHIELARVRPYTLCTLATAELWAPRTGSNPINANIDLDSITFTVPGDLLVVGTKIGTILPDELGVVGGPNFQVTFTDFASATTDGLAPSQVLAW